MLYRAVQAGHSPGAGGGFRGSVARGPSAAVPAGERNPAVAQLN